MMVFRRIGGLAVAAAMVVGVFSPRAEAATIRVEERPGVVNSARLWFEAGAGEDNGVTITAAARHDGLVDLEVVDQAGGLAPGSGCSAADASGNRAICTMHHPRMPDSTPSGKILVPVAGTAWENRFEIDLGDGDDSFDAASFEAVYMESTAMRVTGGSGADDVTTGGGDDQIDPGYGSDSVHGGNGRDEVLATPTPDGPDLYDLDHEQIDLVSYARRGTPVILSSSRAGAVGENDTLDGAEYVVGGSADDSLAASTSFSALDGGKGDDLLVGGMARDLLFGGTGNDSLRGEGERDILVGGDGDDGMSGGDGADVILERAQATEGDLLTRLGTRPLETQGSDAAFGDGGDDRISLGPGADEADGGSGADSVYGESGADRLAGGTGDDTVAGEIGPDSLWGGPGADSVLASRSDEQPYSFEPRGIDTWRDTVDCGTEIDETTTNRWDLVDNCESTKSVPVFEYAKLGRNRRRGVGALWVRVRGPGRLTLLGRGVRRAAGVARNGSPGQNLVVLPIRPRGRTARTLKRRGRVRLAVTIRFRPGDGPARARERTLLLIRAR